MTAYADPQAHTMFVLDQVLDERRRQDERWGVQDIPNGTGAETFRDGQVVHDQNVAEVRQDRAQEAKRSCERAAEAGLCTFRHVLEEEVREAFAEHDPARLRGELVQVAAVAVKWIEKLDREDGRAAIAKAEGRSPDAQKVEPRTILGMPVKVDPSLPPGVEFRFDSSAEEAARDRLDPRWRDRPLLGEGWRAAVEFCVNILRVEGLERGADMLKRFAATNAKDFPPADGEGPKP